MKREERAFEGTGLDYHSLKGIVNEKLEKLRIMCDPVKANAFAAVSDRAKEII